MYSKNFTKGSNPKIIQGEVFTDKDIPPFMSMKEWKKKYNLGDKKWLQEDESVLGKIWQTKNRRLLEMRKKMKNIISEMVDDQLDNQLGNGRMISGEPKNIKYKAGMEVQDINPDCPHRDSRGVVTKVSNGDVTYKVTNFGRHFQPGDELTKSADQLIPLNSEDKPWYIAGE